MSEHLLHAGVDFNKPCQVGRSGEWHVHPLLKAVMDGNLELVRLFLDWDADVNTQSVDQSYSLVEGEYAHTPLTDCVHKVGDSYSAIFDLLLECGADPNLRTATLHETEALRETRPDKQMHIHVSLI